MDEAYLVVGEGVSLRVTASGTLCEVLRDGALVAAGNRDMRRLLEDSDGTRTLQEIVRRHTDGEEEFHASISAVRGIVSRLAIARVLSISPEAVAEAHVPIKEYREYLPSSVSVELTSRCSLKCRYCYQRSGPDRGDMLKDPIGLLEHLHSLGAHTIELTGGEPTLHPAFPDVLEYACTNFSTVGLITNGMHLTEPMLRTMADSHGRASVQISLDGPDPNYVDQIVGRAGAFDRILDGIRRVKAHGLRLRVGMVFDSLEGIEKLEETLELAKSLGADGFLAVPALDYGRARTTEFSFREFSERFLAVHDRLRRKHPSFYARGSEGIDPEDMAPCGAGHRAMTVSWDGRRKLCPMQPAGWFDLGNVRDLLSEESQSRVRAADSMKAPSMVACGDCERVFDCLNCFLRPLGFIESGAMAASDCRWLEQEKEHLAAAGLSEAFR